MMLALASGSCLIGCMSEAPTKRGVRVECSVCGQMKQPIGRDGGVYRRYCDWECPGYRQEPYAGSLWPGETDADFGFPCGDAGTEPVPHE